MTAQSYEKFLEQLAAAKESDVYNDDNSVRFMHEPECRDVVMNAQRTYGLGWEVACEYARFRDAGKTPDDAAWSALIEWDC